jgi:hypothetical protein
MTSRLEDLNLENGRRIYLGAICNIILSIWHNTTKTDPTPKQHFSMAVINAVF